MSDVQIQWNKNVFYDVRRMESVQDVLEQIADGIATRANSAIPDVDGYPEGTEHFVTSSQQGKRNPQGRWRTTVATGTVYAKRHNAIHNTILKAAGGGSGGGTSAAKAEVAEVKAAVPVVSRPTGSGRRRWSAEELGLLNQGLSNAEIASRTGRSINAIVAQRYKK